MDVRRRDRQARPDRTMRLVAALTAWALMAAACGGGSSDDGGARGESPLDDPRWDSVVSGPAASDAEPRRGGSLVVALEAETNSYDPTHYQGTQAGGNVAMALFDPLVTQDADGTFRPYLAESIEPNDDFTEWTLRLRPDVRFHDGTTLDAAALKRIWDDHVTAPGTNTQNVTLVVERMDLVDDLTVKYVMTSPNAQFPEVLEFLPGWPFSPDAADRLGDDFGQNPVGTGPFRFVSWQRDGELVVERNPDYWQDGLPHLDRITFRPIPDESARAASLASADVDAIQSVQLSGLVAEVADIPGVEVTLGLGTNGGVVYFNTTRPPLDDVRIRQALAHAAEQKTLIEVVAGEAADIAQPRNQFFPPGSPYHSEPVAEARLGHDPERARRLYRDYVDDPNRSDGRAAGEPVSLNLDVTNQPSLVELAAAYEGFYEEVGFDITVQPMEQTRSIATTLARDYDVKISRTGANRSPFGQFGLSFGDPATNLSNVTGFYDDTVADILRRLSTARSVEQQAEGAEAMGLHLAEQVPLQWLATDMAFVAAREQVRGLRSWTLPGGHLGDGVLPGQAFWGHVWLEE